MIDNIDNLLQVVEAGLHDIPVLTRHHCAMFQEIWDLKGCSLSSTKSREIEKAYTQKLREQFPEGTCNAWVIKAGEKIAASGAITICSFAPTPIDLSHNLAYLHSVYTEHSFRGRGCAKLLVERAIQYCKTQGLKRVILTASEAGRPVYERFGFQPASDLMRLVID